MKSGAPFRRLMFLVVALIGLVTALPAMALDAVTIPIDAPAVNLTNNLTYFPNPSDRVAVSTAPGPDGIVRRIEVRSADGRPARWAVIALTNTSDQQIDRLLVAPFYRPSKTGLLKPDLGERHIVAITPSQGFAPERLPSNDADVFQLTLDPGSVVTLVFEITTPALPQLSLWQPDAYTASNNSYSLYKGIVLGISGLLAIVLTIVFVVKGTAMFPATAALAWAVLYYIAVDFYFVDEILNINLSDNHIYRASSEVFLSFSLFVFLYAYLNLGRWHIRYSHAAIGFMVLLLGLFGVAVNDPQMAAGIARMALATIGAAGFVLILALAIKGYDRAIMLIPTWFLLIAWMLGAALILTGRLDNAIAQPALSGGLVLIVLLIGFTVMQHAFAGGSVVQDQVGDMERTALALTGAGDPVWDWDVARDHIYTGALAEEQLALEPGTLQGAALEWLAVLHPQDADRFRLVLDAVVEQRRGRISEVFRLRGGDGRFSWFHLRARPVVGADGEVIRCIGTLQDVTEARISEERLLRDAVHDNLTGLPNRELCRDRLETSLRRAGMEAGPRPIMLTIGIDRFQAVNETFGSSFGDSSLLTLARRLERLLQPVDTLARVGGDTFCVIIESERDPERVAALADEMRVAVRQPIVFGEDQVSLTISIGIAVAGVEDGNAGELMRDSELAMVHAKRQGGDRVATFTPILKRLAAELSTLETDFGRALATDEIRIEYLPVIRLRERRLAGFELIARWEHPTRGRIDPAATMEIADRAGLVHQLALVILDRAARLACEWHETVRPEGKPLFSWVNLPGKGVLTQALVDDLRAVNQRVDWPEGSVVVGVTESAVADNPELSQAVLERLRQGHAALALNDVAADWASVGILHQTPFDALRARLPRMKVRGGAIDMNLLRTTAALAHGLGAELFVAGLEQEADVVKLVEAGCDLAAGKLFGPPLNADGARRFADRLANAPDDARRGRTARKLPAAPADPETPEPDKTPEAAE